MLLKFTISNTQFTDWTKTWKTDFCQRFYWWKYFCNTNRGASNLLNYGIWRMPVFEIFQTWHFSRIHHNINSKFSLNLLLYCFILMDMNSAFFQKQILITNLFCHYIKETYVWVASAFRWYKQLENLHSVKLRLSWRETHWTILRIQLAVIPNSTFRR